MLWWKLRRLRASNATTRRCSAVALGATLDRRAIGPLVSALGDENVEVRRAAADALTRIDPHWAESPAAKPATVALLPALAADDLDRRRDVARVLGALGDRRATTALVAALTDAPGSVHSGESSFDYYPVQSAAATALAEIEGQAAVEPLLEITRRTPRDWSAIRAAVGALGQLDNQSAIKPLIQLLTEDPPPNARDAIAQTLAHLDDQSAAVPLAQTLAYSWSVPVIEALERWADPATIEPLVQAGRVGSRQAVALLTKLAPAAACQLLPALNASSRIDVAVMLMNAGHVEALTVLMEALRTLEEHTDAIRSAQAALPALETFFERHSSEMADDLLREASDLPNVVIRGIEEGCGYYGGGSYHETKIDTSRIRQLARQELIRRDPVASACSAGNWEAVAGLGETALPALFWLLTIAEKAQRPKIVRVIGRIGGPQALGPSLEALRDDDAAVRTAGAHALARLKEPSTAEALVVALQDQHKDVRLAAARALPELGSAAIQALKPALKSKHQEIRRTAMEVLAQISDPARSELLAQGLLDPDASVRKVAREALGTLGEPAIPALRDVLHASNWAAVEAASELLAQLGWKPSDAEDRDRFSIGRREFSRASSDVLLSLAADLRYRDEIALELGKRREPRALDRLLARLDGGCTRAEVEALGLMADPRAVQPLIDFLRRNWDTGVGEEAARALGRIGDIRAADALIEALGRSPLGGAMPILVKWLEAKPAGFSDAQLRLLAVRQTILVGTGEMICSTGHEVMRERETSPRLSQLARQELRRRGLEA